VHLLATRLDLAANRSADAVSRLMATLQRKPDRPALLGALAAAQFANGEPQQGRATLDKLTAAAAGNTNLQLEVAKIRLNTGDAQGALVAYRAIGRRVTDAVQPKVGEAAALFKLGRAEEAKGVIRQAQRQLHDPVDAAMVEGEASALGGDWSGALAVFRRAERLAPDRPAAVIRLHQALLQTGALTEAKALLAGAIAGANPAPALIRYAGDQALAAGDFANAVRLLGLTLKSSPKDAAVLNNLAWAKLQMKDPGALALAQQAFDLAPASPRVADTLASALMQAGQPERALPLFKQAAATARDSAGIRLRAIEAMVQVGDKASARREIEQLIADFPNTPEAARARDLRRRT
jgi:tetratricopeptide (TPR) repeat protein